MANHPNRSNRQVLASLLRRKEYAGCTGQISHHGAGKRSVQIFSTDHVRHAARPINTQGSRIVADFDL